jgi:hypothetical protein
MNIKHPSPNITAGAINQISGKLKRTTPIKENIAKTKRIAAEISIFPPFRGL